MNYQELVDASVAYADRNDIEVANNVDLFVTMAEARVNRVLKTRKQSKRATTPTGTDKTYYGLPADYAGMRDVQLNIPGESGSISTSSYIYLSPVEMNEKSSGQGSTSRCNYYTVIANQIQIYPAIVAGNFIEMTYYQKVPNLNSTFTTNWMSEDHPDIYLSGITAEIELFAKNYEVAKGWHDRMSMAIQELDDSDVEERWSGVPLQMRLS